MKGVFLSAVVLVNAVALASEDLRLICNQSKCSVAIVRTNVGIGSGFIVRYCDGKKYFVTNRHVVENASKVSAVVIDGGEVPLGQFQYASNNLDLVRFAVSPDAKALELASDIPLFGDALFVVGNSDGAGVATCIKGELRGIGSDRFELSAKFVCGNSGSPILNADGQVVGVATYALLHNDPRNWVLQDSSFNTVRRFGLRLNDVKWISDDFESFIETQKRNRAEASKANEQAITRRLMTTLNNYLRQYMQGCREEKTPDEVMQAVKAQKGMYCQFHDRWGGPFKFSIISNVSYLASAGIDRKFATCDDIVLTNLCAFQMGVLSLEARRENEKCQRHMARAGEIAQVFKCLTGLSLHDRCNPHEVECNAVKIDRVEYLTSEYRRCGRQSLFDNVDFSLFRSSFTARSGQIFAIELRTENPHLRLQYDSALKQMEEFVGEKFIVGSEMFGVSAGYTFPDNTNISISFEEDGSIVCTYMNVALFQQVLGYGFEVPKVEPRLTSFLGVKLRDEFWNIMDRLDGLKKENGYATARYRPYKKFLNFEDYLVRFSTRHGQINYVECSKLLHRDEQMKVAAYEVISLLERKYGKIAHRQKAPDEDCPGYWCIEFYKAVPTQFKDFYEYKIDRCVFVSLVPVVGAEQRAVSFSISAVALDRQEIDESIKNTKKEDPINAL